MHARTPGGKHHKPATGVPYRAMSAALAGTASLATGVTLMATEPSQAAWLLLPAGSILIAAAAWLQDHNDEQDNNQ